MKKIQISLFSIIIITITGCYIAPSLVYRLEPKSENTVWFWGKEYQKLEENEIEITYICPLKSRENIIPFAPVLSKNVLLN